MLAADLMAVLLARHLRYDWASPRDPGNDHLIFSKGHASPLLYAMFKAAGAITDEDLVTGFRRFGSRLQADAAAATGGWLVIAEDHYPRAASAQPYSRRSPALVGRCGPGSVR